ncbi:MULTISPECIES: GerMN domain-containing protein [Trichocoleus]|uniref:GerMN domain-containing protein n=1 Tax=Trichocoleus desertorum GB2-A4 TaxID=2933944 RepID=A0ABV0J801_9CYAN|nr:GerMN domain-containing protein [Trichocoleus sp. FACHB-46]MBD1862108.1 GerMN domain-containing protein [Trichocoleus sp. FACHB-46]
MFNLRNSLFSCLAIATLAGVSLYDNRPTEAKPVGNVAQASTVAATTSTKPVKVFFPTSRSQQDFSYVAPVVRRTQTQGVAQFAIEQLVAGPTSQERQQGFRAPLNLQGSSNCGRDFKLVVSTGVAKLQFCKQVVSNGIGDDARIKSSITTTLKQFPSINSVVLLDRNGNCLNDQSGNNRCLQQG